MPTEASSVPEWRETEQIYYVRQFNSRLDSLEAECESAEEGVRRIERLLQELDGVNGPQGRLSLLDRSLHAHEDMTSGRNRLLAYLAGVVDEIGRTVDPVPREALLGRAAALKRRTVALAPSLDAMRKSLERHSAHATASGLAAEVDAIERAVAAHRGTLLKLEQRLDVRS